MSEDVWAARDTTPDDIDAALRELLRERHAANRALAPARVLNMVVVVDRQWKGEIANRLERVGRYHASRTILCAVEEGRDTLDAVATISYDDPSGRGMQPVYEGVEVDMGLDQLPNLDTIVDPILVADLPTLLWSPHGHDEAIDALLSRLDVILVDSDEREQGRGLDRAAELLRSVYVVDLAWLRTTPWRERLAATFDVPERRSALTSLDEVTVRHNPNSTASAALLIGWLGARLRWNGGGPGVGLVPAGQEVPGLAGVTVAWDGGNSFALDRARGGLEARQLSPGGEERTWKVLGASRGEGLILGEGVRQALLRDPTYGPALAQARARCFAGDRS